MLQPSLNLEGRPADSNAFIIPQWGGIVVHNSPGQSSLDVEALATVYRTFHTQLLALLGVPLIPRNVVYLPPTSGAPLSHWQISALLRARTRENTRKSVEALQSIVSLVNQIKNMPVKTDVVSLVNRALAALDNVNFFLTIRRHLLIKVSGLSGYFSGIACYSI